VTLRRITKTVLMITGSVTSICSAVGMIVDTVGKFRVHEVKKKALSDDLLVLHNQSFQNMDYTGILFGAAFLVGVLFLYYGVRKEGT
jgi:hypothetical protein